MALWALMGLKIQWAPIQNEMNELIIEEKEETKQGAGAVEGASLI